MGDPDMQTLQDYAADYAEDAVAMDPDMQALQDYAADYAEQTVGYGRNYLDSGATCMQDCMFMIHNERACKKECPNGDEAAVSSHEEDAVAMDPDMQALQDYAADYA